MNFPDINLMYLKELANLANARNPVPGITEPAKQGMKMKAVLEMVLSFYDPTPWNNERNNQWIELQHQAGVENIKTTATTKVLCNTIREVLGLKKEQYKDDY